MSDYEEVSKMAVELVAGGVAGVIAQVTCHPMDTVKTIYQHHPELSYITVTKGIFKIGIKNFWRGSAIPATTFGIVNSICFGSYYYTKKRFDPENKSVFISAACATFSGFCQLIPWVPSEVIKIQMQQTANLELKGLITVRSTTKLIYYKRGIKGFYHGIVSQSFRDIPNNVIYFVTYEKMCKYLEHEYNFKPIEKSIVAGGITGVVAWAVVIPMDLVKTRIQTDKDKDIRSSVKSILSLGLTAFFRGTAVTLIRAFGVNSLIFLIYEEVQPLLRPIL